MSRDLNRNKGMTSTRNPVQQQNVQQVQVYTNPFDDDNLSLSQIFRSNSYATTSNDLPSRYYIQHNNNNTSTSTSTGR